MRNKELWERDKEEKQQMQQQQQQQRQQQREVSAVLVSSRKCGMQEGCLTTVSVVVGEMRVPAKLQSH
jgi:hypothetical protein